MPQTPAERLYVALDTAERGEAARIAHALAGRVGGLKLGLEFFCAQGPEGVRGIQEIGLPVFLDLKLHDIPNTVAGAVRAVAPLGPSFITLHASGGAAMLRAACDAAALSAKQAGVHRPRLLGVTVLTSLGRGELAETGQQGSPEEQSRRLAALGRANRLDGVVCSPQECAALRRALGPEPLLMVPGVRLHRRQGDDQRRVLSPAEALRAGADYLVVGRPVTGAKDPAAAVDEIAATLPKT